MFFYNKTIKTKKLNNSILRLYYVTESLVALSFSNEESILRAKTFSLSITNKSLNREILRSARKEFKKWLYFIWENDFLANDDSYLT